MINDLLDISKIEAGKFSVRKKRENLVSLVSDVVGEFSLSEIKNENLKVTTNFVKENIFANIDSERITQVLSNLLSNAGKFTSSGFIDVSIKVEDKLALVSVTDTGEGISEEDSRYVFKKFHQVEKKSNTIKNGTGLGLALSKELVELHGGKIWHEKPETCGSRFVFSLGILEP
jgi:two-component system sensor histidine kinase VicK